MKLLRVSQVANMTALHPNTLRRLHKEGKLVPYRISDGGTRYYSEEDVLTFMGLSKPIDRKIIGYCRVSSTKQQDDLEKQVENIKTYMYAKGYNFEIITDIGSGINYNKKGLESLIEKICNNEVEKIVILYKDRLIGFGYGLIEKICKIHNTEIEIVDNSTTSKEEELVKDLIQIVTAFSCKLHGRRAKQTKEMLQELRNDINQES